MERVLIEEKLLEAVIKRTSNDEFEVKFEKGDKSLLTKLFGFLKKKDEPLKVKVVQVMDDNTFKLWINGKVKTVKFVYDYMGRLTGCIIDGLVVSARYLGKERPRPKQVEKDIKEYRYKTELAGKIVKILKPEGTYVKKGEVVLIFESMKMENEIISAIDGYVEEIFVKENDTVLAGTELFLIKKKDK